MWSKRLPFLPFSVQQCPSEHEDPAPEPDSIDGELGTPSDCLPPTHYQLHGLLQLGEAWCSWRKYLYQDRGPEHGECYYQLPLTPAHTRQKRFARIFIFFFSKLLFLFQHGCGLHSSDWFAGPQMYPRDQRGWLDQWQCVEQVTGCDELWVRLLDDMWAQTLPCHSPV